MFGIDGGNLDLTNKSSYEHTSGLPLFWAEPNMDISAQCFINPVESNMPLTTEVS
jgi:hypothetical protein